MRAADYIRATALLPFVWGQRDCALWAASLVAEATGRDPAAALRGTYSDWAGCRAVLARHGGMLSLARDLMDNILPESGGDGVCVAEVGARRFAGVVSHGRLFLKTERGVIAPEHWRPLARWAI